MISRFALAGLLTLIVSACERSAVEEPAAPAARAEGVVVVQALLPEERYLPGLFADFTHATGIRVEVQYPARRFGTSPANNPAQRDHLKGDVLLSDNLAEAWALAEAGDLRPLGSALIQQRVPAAWRDADDYWAPLAVRAAAIAYDSAAFALDDVSNFERLADEAFRGKLCLNRGSGMLQTVVATLIDKLGQRPAELVVRGWMANLAAVPFDDEEQLRAALADGHCGVALVTLDAARIPATPEDIAYHLPLPVWVDLEVLGLLRHAQNPESARLFVEWLVTEAEYPGKWHAGLTGDLAPGNISAAGWRAADSARLLERVGYR